MTEDSNLCSRRPLPGRTGDASTRSHNLKKNLIARYNRTYSQAAAPVALLCLGLAITSQLAPGTWASDSPSPLTSRAAFLRAQRAAQRQAPAGGQANQTALASSTSTTTTSTTTARPPKIVKLEGASAGANRSTRTTDIFENGQGFNIFVTTLCERERMAVNIKTSEPFYGIIHTREHRNKPICTVEGTGQMEYNLELSQVLNKQDPAYCGVSRAPRQSPGDKDLLSVIVAVRVHRNIERGDDKFFLLNCTNLCRRDDCSSPASGNLLQRPREKSGRVLEGLESEGGGGAGGGGGDRDRDRETVTPATDGRPFLDGLEGDKECNIYKFPWVITLLWCMGILLLALIISHCIMCSSLVCRCVKTEVEDREPSVYEDNAGRALQLSDDEDNLYNKKNHPMRIDYDNRDIYKTSNNYEPYDLRDDCEVKPKTRHSKASRRR